MEHTENSNKITLPSRESGSPAQDKRKKISWIVRIAAVLIFCVVFYFVNTAGFADMHQKLYSEHKSELEMLVRVVTRYDLVVSMHGQDSFWTVHAEYKGLEVSSDDKADIKRALRFLPNVYRTSVTYSNESKDGIHCVKIRMRQRSGPVSWLAWFPEGVTEELVLEKLTHPSLGGPDTVTQMDDHWWHGWAEKPGDN